MLGQLEIIAQTNGEFTSGIAKNILTRYGRYFGPENCEHKTGLRNSKTEAKSNTFIIKTPFQVYPNPAQDQVTFERFADHSNAAATLILTDITGKIVWQQQMRENVLKIVWQTSSMPGGIYFYRLQEQDGTGQGGKIILQK